jgi:CheY-like chemotaxis protein/glycine cleavage system H lipoate-binding protein
MKEKFDILVIDDEQVIVDAVSRIILNEGLSIDSSLNAIEALQKLKTNEYKLIICDIMMPQMDGFQFLEKIRDQKIVIPVIVTTGLATIETAVKSLKEGAICFLPKPFSADEIISTISRGMEYYKLIKRIQEDNSRDSYSQIPYVSCPAKYFRLGQNSWINSDSEGSVFIGVTDLYLKTISIPTEISLFKPEDIIIQGNRCAEIVTDNDLTHQLLSPLSGTILDVNRDIIKDKLILEKDPYFKGWLYRIIPSNFESELENLIS